MSFALYLIIGGPSIGSVGFVLQGVSSIRVVNVRVVAFVIREVDSKRGVVISGYAG